MRQREIENAEAIGGMRNPLKSIRRIPKSDMAGRAVFKLLKQATSHPSVKSLVDQILTGGQAAPISAQLIDKLRQLVCSLSPGTIQPSTAKACTPLQPQIFDAWGRISGDPDSPVLAQWLRSGAPLGFTEPIPCTGIFPVVKEVEWEAEAADQLLRSFENWDNHPSAVEWEEDLHKLIDEAASKGFCSFYPNMAAAEREIGIKPVLNKLGLLVKEKQTPEGVIRKARIIWDMRESGTNKLCSQGERVLLPRVTDAIEDALEIFRKGGKPAFLAVDIRDAFHNIPSGKDRAFTSAAFRDKTGTLKIVVYDVLVFGSVSSPTLWGRYAAWFGRSLASINPDIRLQTYVDDPLFTFDCTDPYHKERVGISLLWSQIAGYPLKLEKSDSGTEVKWIGAVIKADHDNHTISVTIPEDKVAELKSKVQTYLRRPVIGRRQLQSLAGALSFVAGLVPLMRPFLNSLWAALATNDGPKQTRNVVHVRRIGIALQWIDALLGEKAAPFTRVVRAFRQQTKCIIITDASTRGLGAIMIVGDRPVEFFSTIIPQEFIVRTGAQPGDPSHMALWESLCLLLAARTWLIRFPLGSIIRVKSDNISALHMLAKGKAKSPGLAMIAREIALDQAKGIYEFTILQHLNTKLNKVADALSRQFEPSPPCFPHEDLGAASRIPIQVDSSFWHLPKGNARSFKGGKSCLGA